MTVNSIKPIFLYQTNLYVIVGYFCKTVNMEIIIKFDNPIKKTLRLQLHSKPSKESNIFKVMCETHPKVCWETQWQGTRISRNSWQVHYKRIESTSSQLNNPLHSRLIKFSQRYNVTSAIKSQVIPRLSEISVWIYIDLSRNLESKRESSRGETRK